MLGYRSLALLVAGILIAAPARAQQSPAPDGQQLVDAVLAVVGDSVVLRSDVELEIARLDAAGQLPRDPAVLARLQQQVLQQKIDELVLLQAAAADTTLVIDPAQVESMVQREIAQLERTLGGAAALDAALVQDGLTRAQFRDMKAAEYRRRVLIQQYLQLRQRDRRPPPVTEAEIRTFFEAQKQQLGTRPATISFEQVVVAPVASDSARAAARARAQEVLTQLRNGEEFELLARRHSEDPSNREKGGDLGWFRRGQMVRAFEEVVFAMRPGQTSGVVETPFGFHIIRLDKVRSGERRARHILIRVERTAADAARTREVAENVAQQARNGTPIDSLVKRYGDDSEQSKVGPYPRDRLPTPYDTELADAQMGAVIGPFRLVASDGSEKWAVVKVTEVQTAGEYSLADATVHAQVREQLQREKLIEEIIGELRRKTHIDVRS